jgi:predicted GNAT superfamily acetyltransferase
VQRIVLRQLDGMGAEVRRPVIRDSTEADFDALLRLNLMSESFLSPLPLRRLQDLHAQACYRRVISVRAGVDGFLLGLCRYY